MHSWASICICSGLWYGGSWLWGESGVCTIGSTVFSPATSHRGLVVLSPERSYALELRTENQDSSPHAVRIHRSLLPGRTCIWNRHGPVPSHSPTEPPKGPHHSRWVRMFSRKGGCSSEAPTAQAAPASTYGEFAHSRPMWGFTIFIFHPALGEKGSLVA